MKVPIELYLICFAAGSVIHGVQTFLSARLMRQRTVADPAVVRDSILLGVTTFFWQFGNFLSVFVGSIGIPGSPAARTGGLLRDVALVSFPLVFSYLSLHLPPDRRPFPRIGRYLRAVLIVWTALAIAVMTAGNAGVSLPAQWFATVSFVTLHLMLLYFVVFTVSVVKSGRQIEQTKSASLIRARRAGIVAGSLAIVTFVLMLSGYWQVRVPFLGYFELAAMMSSVPFGIAVAYRQYQFPFMDTFIREAVSGCILAAVFAPALLVSKNVLWLTALALLLAYAKAPLGRWVERTLIGYEESVEEQEQRTGAAIAALTQFDEFGARASETLAMELQADWAEIGPQPRPDAAHRFEIPGSGLWLAFGLRSGGRRYMSRHLRVARTAALQLAAHHHQLRQHELRATTARAQMRALQAQINPHFLFNTLNVLANLIHSDPAKAERVTEELAEVFRYALESTRNEWVRLDDELRFIESYLGIEKARFQERLNYTFDVASGLRSLRIPPMILQPLVENAIRHGIGPNIEGGEIRLSAKTAEDGVVLTVEDTGSGPHGGAGHRGSGIGLSNVRERLHHLYGTAGGVELERTDSGGMRAVLRLPQPAGVRS